MIFTKPDLLIHQDRLDQITAALANPEHPDPIGEVIAEEIGAVEDHTARYELSEGRSRRLVRALVLFKLYASGSLGGMPEEIRTSYQAALAELNAIKAGEFKDLPLKVPTPPEISAAASACWGSGERV